ncbi:glycosyltransferase family 2 protein [Zavarzinia sp. CC-PAN008]|uniref:glycosyltransferase family 2 protein n=1 Tax=Zavarzinia sp. CC-PAN008 TaxID=3243332 RepID=UPI003F7438FC
MPSTSPPHAEAASGVPVLSVVVPMHNEEPMLDLLFGRLKAVLDPLGESYEIVCVDDGSKDATVERLASRAAADPTIRIVKLSRNFGKENAITAGLDHARGQAIVPMDADLQDPPELIPEFLGLWRQGYDVVYGLRRSRNEDTAVKRQTARAFYRVFNALTEVRIPSDAGDFRLMDRRVVEAVRRLPERNRFNKGIFAWVGFRQVAVPYDRPERAAGTSKWPLWRLWNFALDGITGFSTLPLRLWSYLGFVVAVASIVYGSYLVLRVLFLGVEVPGYASTMAAVLFLGGIQLLTLGIFGEYLGRLYGEAKRRPLYIVDRLHGFDDAPPLRNDRRLD